MPQCRCVPVWALNGAYTPQITPEKFRLPKPKATKNFWRPHETKMYLVHPMNGCIQNLSTTTTMTAQCSLADYPCGDPLIDELEVT